MIEYTVYNIDTKESETHYSLTAAKKRMRELMKQGFRVEGNKTKVYSNGEWVNCGSIDLKGCNKVFVANTRMTKANY